MRVVAGELRGRPIRTPPGEGTRPTSDRARQAVFNILEHAPWSPGLEGARVLDVFAGSGAMGLEALSRGAAEALFIETAEPALAAIRANLAAFGLGARGRLLRQDATRLAGRAEAEAPFDLAFLDPPYGKGLGELALAALRAGGWLAPEALAVLEQAADEPALAVPGYELADERRYGAAKVAFLRAG
jgi:16S rRNA (guanine966-N2)-methyltransferase